MYDRGPGGLLVVLVIHHCVNTMEAMMLTACSNEEDEHEVNASVGCKAEGRSTAVYSCHLVGLLVAVDSLVYVYTCVCKCGRLLSSRKMMPAWYCLMVHRAGDKKMG